MREFRCPFQKREERLRAPPESLIGTRIGHLMIVDELGLGGMGRVDVASDDRL